MVLFFFGYSREYKPVIKLMIEDDVSQAAHAMSQEHTPTHTLSAKACSERELVLGLGGTLPWQQLHSFAPGSSRIPPPHFFFWLLQTSYMHHRASVASLLGKSVDRTPSGGLLYVMLFCLLSCVKVALQQMVCYFISSQESMNKVSLCA